MTSVLLIIAILIPTFGGLAALRIPFKSSKSLHIYIETVALITTAVVLLLAIISKGSWVTLMTFAPGFKFVLGFDGLGKLYAVLVALMWPIVLLYSFSYMEHDNRQRSFFGFYILTYGATLGVCFSGSPLTLFVFFEMLSISTLPLVAHYQNHESLFSARKYAAYLFGGAALGFAAVVMVSLNGATGEFKLGGDLVSAIGPGWKVFYLLAFLGFGIKAAIFPFHAWLPAASCAPTPVTALLHAVAVVNTGVFAVIRITYYSFGTDVIKGSWVQVFCLVLSSFTLVYTSIIAVKERHVKRRLAYSTVSNLSYMLFGILLLTPEGMIAGTTHLVFHSITKITLFMCIGSFMEHTGKAYMSDINGVGKYMPHTFICYTISALSLVGIPLLCCFVSKWRLIMAGIEEASTAAYIGIGALILSAFLCAIYSLSVSIRAFFPSVGTDNYEGLEESNEGGWRMLIPIHAFTACQIILGLFPTPILIAISKIAEGLI
ncbi:MAG: proton-conducting membrane transporter [Firmicutes bacterium]|nr:proton-conducting membrane transporter [Bacillota bacterium]